MNDYVTLKELADEIGLDKSNTRRYVIKHGFAWSKVRTKESGNQVENVLSKQDADAIMETRKKQGFSSLQIVQKSNVGWFYVIQVVPELDPLRIKLGFSSDTERRLAAYKTVSPTANILALYPCKLTWEKAAIESVTRVECVNISNEVFQCKDLSNLIERCSQFFELMPKE
jgi:hypothetical protein